MPSYLNSRMTVDMFKKESLYIFVVNIVILMQLMCM